MAKKAVSKAQVGAKKVTRKVAPKSELSGKVSSGTIKKVQKRHLGLSAKSSTSNGKVSAASQPRVSLRMVQSSVSVAVDAVEQREQSRPQNTTAAATQAAIPIPVRTKGYRPGAFEATKTLAELSNEPINFKVGDNAVYPGHGVGRVNAIETKEIAGTQLTFYSIQIIESGMKIMVPQANVKSVGLRPIISKEEAYTVIDILRQTQVKIDNQTWNRRYREYMEKIKTGGVREIAEVLRDLFLLKVDKELSFGERKMLDTARSLLIKELILATSQEELLREDHVKAILGLEG